MSNFLKGLVQRGAGLPLPVTIRPAAGPQQQAASVPTSFDAEQSNAETTRAASMFSSNSPATQDTSNANFAERNESISQPAAASPEPRSAIQSVPMPLPVAPRLVAAPNLNADANQRPGTGKNTQPQEPLTATRMSANASEEDHTTSPRRTMPESRPAAQPSQPKPEPRSIHQDAAVNFDQSPLAPKQERVPVVRLPQPAPSVPRIVEKKTTPEPRNIQVKIGRVEIRSSQPATVVKPTRPQSPGGFGDWKLARTYLDRSLR